jgi:tetratricopeptide (TPR) repeat protein
MIAQAYVMGNLGKAAFQQDGKWFLIHADEPTSVRPWHVFDHNLWSIGRPDIITLAAPKSVEDIAHQLQVETTRQQALTLALQLMDTDIERADLKIRIATLLTEYLADESVRVFVERKLLSTVSSTRLVPASAAAHCRAIGAASVAEMYDLVHQATDAIAALHAAWTKVAIQKLEDSQRAYTALELLVEAGHFAAWVKALVTRDPKKWDAEVINATFTLRHANITSDGRLLAALKTELGSQLALLTEAPTLAAADNTSTVQEIERMIETYLSKLQQQRGAKRSTKDIKKALRQKEQRTRQARIGRGMVNLEGLMRNLEYSTQQVVQALQANETELAWQHVKNLLEKQMPKSEPTHLCKSLTNLATAVFESGNGPFAREILDFALMFDENDAAVHCLNAEVLKSEGDLAGAKAAYEAIKNRFPDNVVAQNGYAEVLKSEGDLAGAKAAYEAIKNRFPNDVVAQNGYAEVLKSEGDLAGAKAAYEAIKNRFPDNVVAQNGYAEVLKSEGDLAGAKAAYQAIRQRYPHNEVAQHAYFNLLLITNQSVDEAPEVPTLLNRETDYYWLTFHIHHLTREGQWVDAMQLIERGLSQCKFDKSRKMLRRQRRYVRLQLGSLQEDQAIAELFAEPAPEPIDHVLRTHLFGALGRTSEAYEALDFCKKYQQIKVVYEAACLLSERYQINGLPQTGQPNEVLDVQIRRKEWEALTLLS